jgi:outer membrane receptor protein involved in Fe transport
MSRLVSKTVKTSLRLGSFAAALCAIPAAVVHAQVDRTDKGVLLEEVVVTASHRKLAISDVALSVSAVTSDYLDVMGADDLQDYYRIVPNFAVIDFGAGSRVYAIRGVSSGIVPQGASTVGVYIDEMPVTADGYQPDLSVYDLDRIEVLRGPQGTLFGEGSLGGTLRMITPNPDTESTDVRVSADFSSTEDGGNNTAVGGMANFALTKNSALRITGYYRDYGGYIDQIAIPEGIQMDVGALVGAPGAFPPVRDTGPVPARSDINDEETWGGRVSWLWNATDKLQLKVNFLTQSTDTGGKNTSIQSLGSLETDFLLPEEGSDDLDLLNLTFTYGFAGADLLSSTSLYERDRTTLSDNSDLGGQLMPGLKLVGAGTWTNDFQDQFSQELRLTSRGDGRLRWTAGLFFVDKEDGFDQVIVDEQGWFIDFTNILFRDLIGFYPTPPFPLTDPRQLLDLTGDFEETQFAIYGEIEYQFSEAWSGTLGLRYYDYDKTDTITNNDINILGLGLQDGVYKTDDSGVTPKFGASYKPNADLLIYGTVSQGFRIGGTNTAPGIPSENITYGPDSLWNYELGLKKTMADGRVQLNSAIYYVDWTDIQLVLPLGFSFGNVNAGKARVIGGELELSARPSEHWELSLALGLNDGELTEDVPNANDPANPNPGFDGDPLPGTPDINLAASAQYNFPLGSFDGFARFDYTYTGDSTTTFNELSIAGSGESSHFELDAYSLLNLRFGFATGHWTTTIYADNVTDEQAELLIDNSALAVRVTRNRPRTIGLKLQYDY